jgi:hypothetical protein
MGVVSFTPRPFHPHGNSSWYQSDMRLGGSQSRSGRGGEEKNSQPLPGLESPIIQPVAERYITELSRLPPFTDFDTRGARGWWNKQIHSWYPTCRLYLCSYILLHSEPLKNVRRSWSGRTAWAVFISDARSDTLVSFHPLVHLRLCGTVFSVLC